MADNEEQSFLEKLKAAAKRALGQDEAPKPVGIVQTVADTGTRQPTFQRGPTEEDKVYLQSLQNDLEDAYARANGETPGQDRIQQPARQALSFERTKAEPTIEITEEDTIPVFDAKGRRMKDAPPGAGDDRYGVPMSVPEEERNRRLQKAASRWAEPLRRPLEPVKPEDGRANWETPEGQGSPTYQPKTPKYINPGIPVTKLPPIDPSKRMVVKPEADEYVETVRKAMQNAGKKK